MSISDHPRTVHLITRILSRPRNSRVLVAACFSLLLGACGGGGSGSSEAASNTGPVSVSGAVVVARYSGVDKDLESAGSAGIVTQNNSFNDAQAITDPVTLGGYISGNVGEYSPGNTFTAYDQDLSDIYEVRLIEGQQIGFSVFYASDADFNASTPVDIDIRLIPTSNTSLVDASETLTAEQTVTLDVTRTDDYYIQISAQSGASAPTLYSLSLSQSLTQSLSEQDALGAIDLRMFSREFVPGELIVAYKEAASNTTGSARSNGRESVSRSTDSTSRALLRKGSVGKAGLYRLNSEATSLMSFDTDSNLSAVQQQKWQTLAMMTELEKDPEVDYVEPNYLYRAFAPIASPSDIADARYSQQWNMPMLGLPAAWQVATGAGVRVAVIDTGIHPSHLDLNDNISNEGYDFVSITDLEGDLQSGPDADPTDTGTTYHGSHVSGIIAAEDNIIGVRGVAYDASLVPLRALGVEGVGSTADIANAMRYAAGLSNSVTTPLATPVDIINMSLGSQDISITLQSAIAAAQAQGVIVVAAAGNESTSALTYPAAYPGVIGVSSINERKKRSGFSNYGSYVDVAAPGGTAPSDEDNGSSLFDGFQDGVLSTVFANEYSQLIGTSMAAPHVAGIIALMRELDPTMTASEFLGYLSAGSITDDINDPGFTSQQNADFFGAGLINAAKAVDVAGTPPPDTLVVFPGSLGFIDGNSSATLSLTNPGSGSVTIDSISANQSWLSLTGSGLGDYLVEVNLPSAGAIDSAVITISYSINGVPQANPIEVDVFVSKSSSVGDTVGSDLRVYLVRWQDIENALNSGQGIIEIYAEVGGVLNQGVYSFNFSDIPEGLYVLEASTDNDGDNLLFDLGEAKGVYPVLSAPQLIQVGTSDVRNLNFDVSYQSFLSSGSSVGPDHHDLPRRRLTP